MFINNNDTIEHQSTLIFVGNGQVSFENNNNYWMGNWTTNNGELYLKFENNTINGKYDYKILRNGGNGAVAAMGQAAIIDLELSPIEIDDSLTNNNLVGVFSSVN